MTEDPWREELEALLVLKGLSGVGDRTIFELMKELGGAGAALAAPERDFARIGGVDAARQRGDPELAREARETLDRARDLGLHVMGRGGEGYPPALEHLHDPPPVLFLRGDPSLLEPAAVAVVGSRRATSYGRRVAEQLGSALAREEIPVVSGLALGVDGAAHRGALAEGGRVIGVLGSGVDVPHPPTNSALFRKVGEEHLLVSEFLPGEPPFPYHFPQRNRILAALSEAVIVVEAAERSGALITTDHAMDLGRQVLAVPGPVDRRTSRGTNALIRDGARLIDDPARIVELLPALAFGGGVDGEGRRTARLPEPPGDGGRIWRALQNGPLGIDELAREVELEPAHVLALLSDLEVRGWVEPRPGMVYARSRRPAS